MEPVIQALAPTGIRGTIDRMSARPRLAVKHLIDRASESAPDQPPPANKLGYFYVLRAGSSWLSYVIDHRFGRGWQALPCILVDLDYTVVSTSTDILTTSGQPEEVFEYTAHCSVFRISEHEG